MNRYTLLSALGLVFAAVGCSGDFTGPDSRLLASTDRSTYETGTIVTVNLTNISQDTIVYGLCGMKLEHSVKDGWQDTGLGGPPCQAIGLSLLPGDHTSLSYPLPNDLSAGTYRLKSDIPAYQTEGFAVTVPPNARLL